MDVNREFPPECKTDFAAIVLHQISVLVTLLSNCYLVPEWSDSWFYFIAPSIQERKVGQEAKRGELSAIKLNDSIQEERFRIQEHPCMQQRAVSSNTTWETLTTQTWPQTQASALANLFSPIRLHRLTLSNRFPLGTFVKIRQQQRGFVLIRKPVPNILTCSDSLLVVKAEPRDLVPYAQDKYYS